MALAERWTTVKRGGFGLLFSCISTLAVAQIIPPAPDPHQTQFEAGLRNMFEGRYEQATSIFEDLYRKTRAVRVKLEWARAAFLWKRYELSRSLFDQVLEQPVPDVVRFNV